MLREEWDNMPLTFEWKVPDDNQFYRDRLGFRISSSNLWSVIPWNKIPANWSWLSVRRGHHVIVEGNRDEIQLSVLIGLADMLRCQDVRE